MIEKHIILLFALPFLAELVIILVNMMENPVGTIHGMYKFQLSLWDKIFTRSNGSET